MFSLFVRRDGLIEPPSMGEIDSHCHILPGLDDGSPDMRTSSAIADILVELGVKIVVATPHVMKDVFPVERKRILEKTELLQRVFSKRGIPLKLIPGAEYYVETELLKLIERSEVLCWGERRYVLIESPVECEPKLLSEAIFCLKTSGYTPLLAHVERYRFLQQDQKRVDELRRMGACFQVNHPSFYLPATSRRGQMARRLYIKGMVDQLGTDIHTAALSENANVHWSR